MNKLEFDNLKEAISSKIPNFSIKYKNESLVQRIIGLLVYLFNPGYMTHITTTASPVVWFPSKEYVEEDYHRAFNILAHEFVHLTDQIGSTVWFDIKYMFPQILGVLGLLGFLGFAWSWCFWLFFLLAFALPLPAPWRAASELRGYAMSMACEFWFYGYISQQTKDFIAKNFYGSTYYFMSPLASKAKEMIEAEAYKIQYQNVMYQEPYSTVHDIIVNKSKG